VTAVVTFGSLVAFVGPKDWHHHGGHYHDWHDHEKYHHHDHGDDIEAPNAEDENSI